MMLVWIVWSNKPIAVFSSEERARNYIARNGAEEHWVCSAAHINPEGVASETRRSRVQRAPAHAAMSI